MSLAQLLQKHGSAGIIFICRGRRDLMTYAAEEHVENVIFFRWLWQMCFATFFLGFLATESNESCTACTEAVLYKQASS